MRSRFPLLLANFALVATGGAVLTSSARAQDDLELDHFTYRVEEFDAPSIEQGSSEYVIYLPKAWQPPVESDSDQPATAKPAKRYPVAIWLHGMRESYRRFHTRGGPQILDRLRDEDKIDDMVFVAVSATRRPVYLNGLDNGNFVDLIVKDLLAHLEQNYPVATDAAKRAIMGVSIGGMGAINIALSTDKFGTVATHSASVLPAKFEDISQRMRRRIAGMARQLGIGEVAEDPAKWSEISTLALVRDTAQAHLDGLNIYFDAGDADRYGFGPANEALHTALDTRKVAHSFELVQDGGHSWGSGSTQRQLPKSLEFVSASFRGRRPASRPSSRPAEPQRAGTKAGAASKPARRR